MPNDRKSIDFVGHRYSERRNIHVTLFHAYTPVPQIDTQDSPIMAKVVQNTALLRLKQEEQKHALEGAKKQLMNHGIAGTNINCIFKPVNIDIAADIIQLWKEGEFDVVVLSRNPGNIVNFFSRSISKRIVRHKNLLFCRETAGSYLGLHTRFWALTTFWQCSAQKPVCVCTPILYDKKRI